MKYSGVKISTPQMPAIRKVIFANFISSSRRQQLCGIVVVHVLKNVIRQAEAVQIPVIIELVGCIKMLVERLQNAERNLVHGFVESHVGTVDEAVRIFGVKLRGSSGSRSGFGVACRNVGVQVRATVEELSQPGEIVIEVDEVAGDESRVRMAFRGALENVYHAGEINNVGLIV